MNHEKIGSDHLWPLLVAVDQSPVVNHLFKAQKLFIPVFTLYLISANNLLCLVPVQVWPDSSVDPESGTLSWGPRQCIFPFFVTVLKQNNKTLI